MKIQGLKALKRQLNEEEKLLLRLKHDYPHLAKMNKVALMHYFYVTDKHKLFAYIKVLTEKRYATKDEATVCVCSCHDSYGIPKILYASRSEAESVVQYVLKNRQLQLKIYPCPWEQGWHLSKC